MMQVLLQDCLLMVMFNTAGVEMEGILAWEELDCYYGIKSLNVEYLFSLGQTSLIGKIGSEKGGFNWYETHCPTGEPFWLANTERMIFSRIVL